MNQPSRSGCLDRLIVGSDVAPAAGDQLCALNGRKNGQGMLLICLARDRFVSTELLRQW